MGHAPGLLAELPGMEAVATKRMVGETLQLEIPTCARCWSSSTSPVPSSVLTMHLLELENAGFGPSGKKRGFGRGFHGQF